MARTSQTGIRGLYRTKDGGYAIDFRWKDATTGKPRRYAERLPANISASAAKLRAQKVTAGALAGTFDPRKGESRPKRLAEALKAYLEIANTDSPQSKDWRNSQSKHITRVLGDIGLESLSALSVEKIKKAHGENHGATSVNHVIGIFRCFASFAAKQNWISRDTELKIRAVKKLKAVPWRVRAATPEEKVKIRGVLKPAQWTIIEVLLMTGMRRAEACLMKKPAVDLRNRVFKLTRTKTNTVREVNIPPALVPIIEAAMANATDYVFVNPLGRPFKPKSLTSVFTRACRRAGITDLHLHDCRHTFATEVRRRGHGLDVVAKLLGHSRAGMSERYAHINGEMLRDAVADFLPLPTEVPATDEKIVQFPMAKS